MRSKSSSSSGYSSQSSSNYGTQGMSDYSSYGSSGSSYASQGSSRYNTGVGNTSSYTGMGGIQEVLEWGRGTRATPAVVWGSRATVPTQVWGIHPGVVAL